MSFFREFCTDQCAFLVGKRGGIRDIGRNRKKMVEITQFCESFVGKNVIFEGQKEKMRIRTEKLQMVRENLEIVGIHKINTRFEEKKHRHLFV